MSELLAIYLNDHYAGAVGAVELTKRGSKEHAGTELGHFFGELGAQIEADRQVLRQIMAAAGAKPRLYKWGMAWVAEKVGRLKPNGRVREQSPLSPLIELDALATGIAGKEMLWRALQATPGAPTAGHSLEDLIARAQAQRAAVEEHRIAVARAALSVC
jgi:hypothetical protein